MSFLTSTVNDCAVNSSFVLSILSYSRESECWTFCVFYGNFGGFKKSVFEGGPTKMNGSPKRTWWWQGGSTKVPFVTCAHWSEMISPTWWNLSKNAFLLKMPYISRYFSSHDVFSNSASPWVNSSLFTVIVEITVVSLPVIRLDEYRVWFSFNVEYFWALREYLWDICNYMTKT